jgi:hypothetical protein
MQLTAPLAYFLFRFNSGQTSLARVPPSTFICGTICHYGIDGYADTVNDTPEPVVRKGRNASAD